MTEATKTAPQATQAVEDYSTERETIIFGFNVIKEKDEKTGQEKIVKTPALYSPNKAEELEKEGKFTCPDELNCGIVDVVIRYPKTLEALLKMADTPEKQKELVDNHNRGASVKVGNRLRSKVLVLDDDGKFSLSEKDAPNGVIDLTDEILSESKRRVLTLEEKFDRFVKDNNFTPEVAAKMKAIWMASN